MPPVADGGFVNASSLVNEGTSEQLLQKLGNAQATFIPGHSNTPVEKDRKKNEHPKWADQQKTPHRRMTAKTPAPNPREYEVTNVNDGAWRPGCWRDYTNPQYTTQDPTVPASEGLRTGYISSRDGSTNQEQGAQFDRFNQHAAERTAPTVRDHPGAVWRSMAPETASAPDQMPQFVPTMGVKQGGAYWEANARQQEALRSGLRAEREEAAARPLPHDPRNEVRVQEELLRSPFMPMRIQAARRLDGLGFPQAHADMAYATPRLLQEISFMPHAGSQLRPSAPSWYRPMYRPMA